MEAERWFDELEIVKTPDVDVVLLNDITRVIKIEKFFIALYDEMLIVCSRTDSSSFVYSKVGRGPGEYNSLIDVVYDQRNDKILLLTSYPNRILTIDMEGNFISSYTIPGEIDWDRLYMFRNNLFLFGSVFNPKTNISQNVVAKFEGNTLLEPVVITEKRSKYGPGRWYWTIGERKGNIIAGIDKRDSLFQISENLTITPIRLEFAFEKELPQDRIIGQRLYFINDDKMLWVRSLPWGKLLNFQHRFQYDFSMQKVEFSAGLFWGRYVGMDKDNIYCYLPPLGLQTLDMEWDKISPATRKFYEPLRKALAELDENDNPLLLRYHIKKSREFGNY